MSHLGKDVIKERTYAYIADYARAHVGNTPSFRQIANGIGVGSTATVWRYVHILVNENRLAWVGPELTVVGAVYTERETPHETVH